MIAGRAAGVERGAVIRAGASAQAPSRESQGRAGEPQAARGAAARVVGRRGASAVGGADRLDDGQPEAGPAVVAGTAGVWAPEPLERVGQEGLREARTVVTDLDAKVRAVFPG